MDKIKIGKDLFDNRGWYAYFNNNYLSRVTGEMVDWHTVYRDGKSSNCFFKTRQQAREAVKAYKTRDITFQIMYDWNSNPYVIRSDEAAEFRKFAYCLADETDYQGDTDFSKYAISSPHVLRFPSYEIVDKIVDKTVG